MSGFSYFSIMNTTIRKGIKKDLPSVLKLIKELADYENASDQVTITLDDLEQDGFGTHPWYWFLVACTSKSITYCFKESKHQWRALAVLEGTYIE